MNKKLIILAVMVLAISADITRGPVLTAAPSAGATALCNTPTTAHLEATFTSAWSTSSPVSRAYYWNDNQCKGCPNRCTCADATPTICTGCANPRHIFIAADSTKNTAAYCVDPFSTSYNAEKWPDCEIPCINAADGASTCSKCSVGFYFDKTKCTACPANCATCSVASGATTATCSVCKTGFYLKDGKECTACDTTKLPSCAACSKDGATCTACTSGNWLISGKCETCPTAAGALSCSAKDVPDKCADGYFLDKSATPAKCTACISNCRVCADSTTCTTCNKDAAKHPQNDWVGTYYDSTAKQCKDCKADTLYCKSTGESLVCVPGKVAINNECLSPKSNCAVHAYENSALYCKTCNTGYYVSAGNCIQAPANCGTTITAGTQTGKLTCTCKTGYAFDATNVKCVAITVGCKTGQEDTTKAVVTVNSVDYYQCKTDQCDTNYVLLSNGLCASTSPYKPKTTKDGYVEDTTNKVLNCQKVADAAACADNNDCNTDHYLDTTLKICKPKTSCGLANCLECTVESHASSPYEKCTKCDATKGYVPAADGKSCVACTKTLNSDTDCKQCPTGKWVDNTNGCVDVPSDANANGCKTWGAGATKSTGCTECQASSYLVAAATDGSAPAKCPSCTTSDTTMQAKLGAKCATCTAAACTGCNSGATLVAGKCDADDKCKAIENDRCLACLLGNLRDATGKCAACDAAKGCAVVGNGNCDLNAKPPGSTTGTVTVTAKSSSALLSFAFSALLLVLAVLF